MSKNKLSRRNILGGLGIGGAAYMLGDMFHAKRADAQDKGKMPLLVMCYFEGGYDTLLSLDPRSEAEYGTGKGGIETQYGQLAASDPALAATLAETNNTGLYTPNGSNITFGPVMKEMSRHYADLCVVRGMNMGTLTHEVGRRYFRTGKFPRGLQASGSDLATWFVHDRAKERTLSNLVVSNESYNEGLDASATGVKIGASQDLYYLMNEIEPPLPGGTQAAINEYLGRANCLDTQLDSSGMVDVFHQSRIKAAELGSGSLWTHFDFDTGNPSAEIGDLFAQFDLAAQNPAAFPAFDQAMTAAQALRYGISQAVSIRLGFGMDHHDDVYQTNHAPQQRFGFDAAAKLIDFLKDPKNSDDGEPLWDRTTLVLWSEFARTPRINSRLGRDHHLASACLVAGNGIRGNTVIGATTDSDYGVRPVDLASGNANDSGVEIRPADVHHTILTAAGLSADHISNQSPVTIDAMIQE